MSRPSLPSAIKSRTRTRNRPPTQPGGTRNERDQSRPVVSRFPSASHQGGQSPPGPPHQIERVAMYETGTPPLARRGRVRRRIAPRPHTGHNPTSPGRMPAPASRKNRSGRRRAFGSEPPIGRRDHLEVKRKTSVDFGKRISIRDRHGRSARLTNRLAAPTAHN